MPSGDSPKKVALITGITGQDGSYLTELLLGKGYIIHGLVRRSSSTIRHRIDRLFEDRSIYGEQLFLHYADLEDLTTIRRILTKTQPDELYHLAGQSHVGTSFEIPESTCQFTAMGTLNLLEIVRDLPSRPRFLYASSSEIFGRPEKYPQTESSSYRPTSPYGVAKAFATNMVRVYRDSYDVFGVNAICYNHESPRRGESFVTRKITRAAAAISAGRQTSLAMGNINARRDWGYAPEYVEAMWRMLQLDAPEDFVLATGKQHSVQEFLDAAFKQVGLSWSDYYRRVDKYCRPSEPGELVGDASKAYERLGWRPEVDFQSLVGIMVEADVQRIQQSASELGKATSAP
ncbi:MAG: GDP-mannose 4,6-dehydratase [Planctomycetota bacterium]